MNRDQLIVLLVGLAASAGWGLLSHWSILVVGGTLLSTAESYYARERALNERVARIFQAALSFAVVNLYWNQM